MTTSNLIHLSRMIAIQGGLISSEEALAPGESAHRFGDYILWSASLGQMITISQSIHAALQPT